uniref:Ricin B lectin domain-containing protein n=1 Tax=Kwoniella dejecticola CBS 10117 TaxID=1296121 RepID=A0A1A6AFN2_9TREE|nr:uncharacterized protein I303_00676 [Kwoniella dejecticola CBS 10117]OBR88859.1 hypothetical protein I303_00676 [Kwoniella dejecticola CBS 10117]
MYFLAAILPLLALTTSISASPIQKRYNGVKIQSSRNDLCLSPLPQPQLRGDNATETTYADGDKVGVTDCADAQVWDINPGSGSIVLTGTNFALDAGTGTDNNEEVKLWTSYPGLFQQTWYFTTDNRIAITGGDQCLDQGNDEEGTQTWQCTTGNTNQDNGEDNGDGNGEASS